MAHIVNLKVNTNVVAHKDVEIAIYEGGKLGTLLISRGNIEWRPAWKQKKKHRLTWKKFAELMTNEGKPVKKRSAKTRAKKQ
jgi:hypothetical protein